MKKFVSAFSIICLFALGNFAFSQNPNSLEARAIGAFHQECGYQGAVNAEVSVTSICFVSGYISEVLITPRLNCQQIDCNAVRIAPLARVHFDCENNISWVECLR